MIEAFSVSEFCNLYGISRSLLYKEWRLGRGPAFMQVGRRRLISRHAAEAWRVLEEIDAAPPQKAAA